MDGGAWWAAVHGVAGNWTQLGDFSFIFHLRALEREMATHSSVLAWRIPGKAEPGGLVPLSSHETWGNWAVTHLSLLKVCASKCSFPCLFMRNMITVSWFQYFIKQNNSVNPRDYFCIYIKPVGLRVWYLKSFHKILWAETHSND